MTKPSSRNSILPKSLGATLIELPEIFKLVKRNCFDSTLFKDKRVLVRRDSKVMITGLNIGV